MLVDMKVERPGGVNIFYALDSLREEFFLTGSRFMGCAREDSDWDFITQDGIEIRTNLRVLGFTSLVEEEYDHDGETNAVYQKVEDGFTVQVQLAKSADIKRKVRDIIATYLPEQHRRATKDDRAYLWQTLGDILRFTPGQYADIPF